METIENTWKGRCFWRCGVAALPHAASALVSTAATAPSCGETGVMQSGKDLQVKEAIETQNLVSAPHFTRSIRRMQQRLVSAIAISER